MAFARRRDGKYVSRATERRGARDEVGCALGEKGDILLNVAGIIWFYVDILPTNIARARSPLLSLHRRQNIRAKCFYIFDSLPPPSPLNRRKPRNLSASQFTRSTIFAARVVSRFCSSCLLYFSKVSS